MNERKYLRCPDPHDLIGFLDERLTERAFRLFAVACCRRIEAHLEDGRSRRIVALTEQMVDELVPREEWQRAAEEASEAEAEADAAAEEAGGTPAVRHVAWGRAEATGAAAAVARANPSEAARMAARYAGWTVARYGTVAVCEQRGWMQRWDRLEADEQRVQAHLLRDVAGNPLRRVALDDAWLVYDDALVVRLAQDIDEAAAFDRLPILGDALEEAGCAEEAILAHARGPGPHVKGCWLVDLVLGKRAAPGGGGK